MGGPTKKSKAGGKSKPNKPKEAKPKDKPKEVVSPCSPPTAHPLLLSRASSAACRIPGLSCTLAMHAVQYHTAFKLGRRLQGSSPVHLAPECSVAYCTPALQQCT